MSAAWRSEGSRGLLNCENWKLDCDFEDPRGGFCVSRGDSQQLTNLMGVFVCPSNAPLQDISCPEDDLVVSYRAEREDRLGLKLRYELIQAEADRLVLQAIVAFETRSFDANPQIAVIIPRDVKRLEAAVTFESSDCAIGIVSEDDLPDQSASEQHLSLFDGFMERGVIRKKRLRLVVAPGGEVSKLDLNRERDLLRQYPLPLMA